MRSEQTARYLKGYGAVLLTNLHEFWMLERSADGQTRRLETYKLTATADELWTGRVDTTHNELLPDFLRRVMLYKVPLSEPKQVAWLLALVCARRGAGAGEEHELPAFRNVKTALEEPLGD